MLHGKECLDCTCVCVCMCVCVCVPGQQDALVLLQLPHEGGVGLSDGAALLDVVQGRVQVPAVLLHGVGDHGGGRATHAHLTVDQTLGPCFPEGAGGHRSDRERHRETDVRETDVKRREKLRSDRCQRGTERALTWPWR